MSTNGELIVRTDPYIFPVLAELVECLCEEITTTGAGPVCWCGMLGGLEVSLEFCGECSDACGMAWVRPITVFPYEVFPIAAVDYRCNLPLAWQVEVGCVRCLPTRADGEPLSPDETAEIVAGISTDSFALYRALTCCAQFGPVAAETWNPIGPDGGCIGGAWTAYLAVDG